MMKNVNKKVLSIFDSDYQNWIKELKTRYKQSQIKAAVRVNSEMIQFYELFSEDLITKQVVSQIQMVSCGHQ